MHRNPPKHMFSRTKPTSPCILALLLCVSHITIPKTAAECINNDTNCTCLEKEMTDLCLRDQGQGICELNICTRKDYMCDCSGTEMCRIRSCGTLMPISGQPIETIQEGSTVPCAADADSIKCLEPMTTHPAPSLSPSPSPSPSPSLSVSPPSSGAPSDMDGSEQAEQATVTVPTTKPVIYNAKIGFQPPQRLKYVVKPFLDKNNDISSSLTMEGMWPNPERLKARYIHVRLYYPDGAGDMFACVIYNKYGSLYDGKPVMRAYSRFDTSHNVVATFVACDDKTECGIRNGKSPSSVFADHRLTSSEVDGFCGGPLQHAGMEVGIKLAQVAGFRGIILQSPNSSDDVVISFQEMASYGITGTLDSYGLIENGDIPTIYFNNDGF